MAYEWQNFDNSCAQSDQVVVWIGGQWHWTHHGTLRETVLTNAIIAHVVDLWLNEASNALLHLFSLDRREMALKDTLLDARAVVFQSLAYLPASSIIGNIVGNDEKHKKSPHTNDDETRISWLVLRGSEEKNGKQPPSTNHAHEPRARIATSDEHEPLPHPHRFVLLRISANPIQHVAHLQVQAAAIINDEPGMRVGNLRRHLLLESSDKRFPGRVFQEARTVDQASKVRGRECFGVDECEYERIDNRRAKFFDQIRR